MKKSTGLISVCLSLPLYFFSIILPCIVGYVVWRLKSNPELKKLFEGHKRTGKIIGALLLSFGNVGLDYFTEKSVACMLTFLFLAVYFLSILCCIQPCTDFGILELLLSACSIVALRRFGVLHFCSWLVVLACLLIDVIRYLLDPEREHQLPSAAVQGSELISVQSHRIEVESNGTEENQLSTTEIIANAGEETEEEFAEDPFSINGIRQGIRQMACKENDEDQEIANAGKETLPSIRNPNIGGDVPIRAPTRRIRLQRKIARSGGGFDFVGFGNHREERERERVK